MEKLKDFLSKPLGMVTLAVVGFVAGWYLAKRKRTGNARR
jgi:F0F1-type ATP synthase assembly protein I